MLDKVKNALRVKTNVFDIEISNLIEACQAAMSLAKIRESTSDPLIVRAIILYAKANFGYDSNAERYREVYKDLKCMLSLAEKYQRPEGYGWTENV